MNTGTEAQMTLAEAIEVFDAAAKIPANPMSSGEARFLAALPVILRAAKAVSEAPKCGIRIENGPNGMQPMMVGIDFMSGRWHSGTCRIVREDVL